MTHADSRERGEGGAKLLVASCWFLAAGLCVFILIVIFIIKCTAPAAGPTSNA